MDASSIAALHLIGIGNGVSVLLSFLDTYGGDETIGKFLKSLVSINGYASIDAQLAGILHSAKNAFQSFPPNRPDLPISYLSHYMFSDQYIDRVSMDLALTIYTAVLNPISLEGRIRLVDGALKNRSMPHVDKIVERVGVPIIAIQSTENRIVASTNVDVLLRGRPVSHIWSHELQYSAGKENDCYSQVGLNDMLNGCFQRDGDGDGDSDGCNADALSSLAIFVRAGHCITQECKGPVCGLLDRLVVVPSSLSSTDRTEPRKDDKHILRLSPPHTRRLPPAEEGGKRRNGVVHARVGGHDNKKDGKKIQQETKTTGNKKNNSSSSNDKQNAEMMPSKLRQSPHGRGKKKRGTKATASAGNTSCTSDWRKLNPRGRGRGRGTDIPPKPKQTSEGGNSDGHEATPEPSPEALEKEGSASPSVMPYIVEGAPNCSLDELMTNETGTLTTVEGGASGKVPKLEDYMSRGVPSELIPTEIKAGPPSAEQKRHRRWDFSLANPTISIAIPSETTKRTVAHPPPPSPPTVEELELQFYKELEDERERETQRIESKRKENTGKSPIDVKSEQMKRRLEYQREDKEQLAELKRDDLHREKERARMQLQRRLEVDEMEVSLIRSGLADPYVPSEGEAPPVRTLPPTRYMHLPPSSRIDPCHFATTELDGILDVLDNDAELVAKKGMLMTVDEFEQIRRKLKQQHLEKEMELRRMTNAERHVLFMRKARDIQRAWRGHQGRRMAATASRQKRRKDAAYNAVILIQKCRRGSVGRIVAYEKKEEAIKLARSIACARSVQRLWRGCQGRRIALTRQKEVLASVCQRLYRGRRGRIAATKERHHQERIRLENTSAIQIQCMWRIGVAIEQCRVHLIRRIASIDLQRIVRGHLARKKAAKMKLWATTVPGPARIELGLRMIKESQDEFERHRDELDGLHRAQEIAETRVNQMFRTLKESEEEVAHLQKQLGSLDDIDDATCTSSIDEAKDGPAGNTCSRSKSTGPIDEAEALERQKRKRYLQSELQDVLSDVQQKRSVLGSLETNMLGMEATRERKDREFKRMQRDLMELLSDQKEELDQLREKGMELETATATTAVAAATTAQKARDHEMQTNTMFQKQEELMKFQFMSMSLSYMSSLGMLKQMKSMASDATATAVSCSADTAAAAAAAATAANLPPPSDAKGGASSRDTAPSHLGSRLQVAVAKAKEGAPDATKVDPKTQQNADGRGSDEPLPSDCHDWTVDNVSTWLWKLSLGMYAGKFAEASVDGEFLLELKEEDLAGVLGMKHKLHRRKFLLAREKLALSPEEQQRRAAAVKFIGNAAPRGNQLVSQENYSAALPSPEAAGAVFSHARHGRLRRLEECLDEGFDVDVKDEQGNTLLMTAVQNGNKKAVDMLIRRGSALNNMNGNGNTALHYALAYDTTGEIATYLIEKGADDTINNRQGLSAYDGLGDDDLRLITSIEEEDEDKESTGSVDDSRIDLVVQLAKGNTV